MVFPHQHYAVTVPMVTSRWPWQQLRGLLGRDPPQLQLLGLPPVLLGQPLQL